MLTKYEEKRLEYNLALNELNKFKKDFENKRIELTKKKFNTMVKEKEEKIALLKKDMDSFFIENQDEIVISMLKNSLNIKDEYEFYSDKTKNSESGEIFINKKTSEEIEDEFNELKNKIEKRVNDKIITSIVYNDLNRCLDIYKKIILDKLDNLPDKKFLSIDESKTVSKLKKNKIQDENWFFVRIMMPIIIIDILCALFVLFTGTECQIGSSDALSGFLCSFTVVSDLVLIFVTPIVLIYLIVKGIQVLYNRKRK